MFLIIHSCLTTPNIAATIAQFHFIKCIDEKKIFNFFKTAFLLIMLDEKVFVYARDLASKNILIFSFGQKYIQIT